MRIGILSDTHGNVTRTATAAALLKVHGVETVFHCGDIGSEQVLIELAGQFGEGGIPVHAVLGNVDPWNPGIARFPSDAGVEVHGARYETVCDGRRVVMLHGHESARLEAAAADGGFDYVLTGHTHCREDRRIGRTRVINPGAVHRTLQPTVAVLDTRSDTLLFVALCDDPPV
jgi:putative phosphoesterase